MMELLEFDPWGRRISRALGLFRKELWNLLVEKQLIFFLYNFYHKGVNINILLVLRTLNNQFYL